MLKRFTVTDDFWGHYQTLIKDTVVPYQEKVLKDQIEGVEKSHALENFRLAAQVIETGKCDAAFYGMVFQDSDVAKWLEAAAYTLLLQPDEGLERRCDEVINIIERAQHPDGYLNTYFTVKEPQRRWTNLREAHELYCAGHMMEAAVAYAQCTGKTKLLNIMCRMADHMYNHFIDHKAPGYPGHPEVELALMKLYRCTGNENYKQLAQHFIDIRGVDPDYYIKESEHSDWFVWGKASSNNEYAQNMLPVRQQTKAVGHAVRGVYLYTGMADVAAETKDESLKLACQTLWENITKCRMYVTGAIGSAYEGEAFTKDYHLPNDTAYAETCAAIGLIFFARKMIDLEKKSDYADVMERALYNCVLAGMQLDGTKFFYVNPLETLPGISGEAATHRHALPQRPQWFACACCPPNVARLLSSLAHYAWSEEESTVYNHLFLGGTLDLTQTLQGKIKVTTSYPYGDQVIYEFEPDHESMTLTLAIRLPLWSENTSIRLGEEEADYEIRDGYAYLTKAFTAEDRVTVTFDMGIKRIFPSYKIAADSGKVAFPRGPLIYCAEGIDNKGDVLSLRIKKDGHMETYNCEESKGIVHIKLDGYQISESAALYTTTRPSRVPCKINLIPYYTWGNRGLNEMRVWLPEE